MDKNASNFSMATPHTEHLVMATSFQPHYIKPGLEKRKEAKGGNRCQIAACRFRTMREFGPIRSDIKPPFGKMGHGKDKYEK